MTTYYFLCIENGLWVNISNVKLFLGNKLLYESKRDKMFKLKLNQPWGLTDVQLLD